MIQPLMQHDKGTNRYKRSNGPTTMTLATIKPVIGEEKKLKHNDKKIKN